MSHIKWDEETIALHDKERGTRQKIDEPNTPFRYAGDLEDEQFNVVDNAQLSQGECEKLTERAPVAPVLTDQWAKINASLEYEAQKQAGLVSPISPTVFHVDVASESGARAAGSSCMVPSSSLPAWKQVGKTSSQASREAPKDEENMTEEEKAHHQAFLKKREAHYNEFKLIQAMKRKQEIKRQKRIAEGKDPDDESDEDEDEDEDEKNEAVVYGGVTAQNGNDCMELDA